MPTTGTTYTPEQIASINSARADAVSKGENPYAGAGATNYSNDQGQNARQNVTPTTGAATVPMTPDNLAPAAPFKTSVAPYANAASGLSGAVDAVTTTTTADLAQAEANRKESAKIEAERQKKDTLLGKVTGFLTSQKGQTQLTDEQYAATVDPAEKELKAINNQIISSQRAQTNEIRALEKANLTDIGRATAAREINRDYAFEQADLAIIQLAKQGQYDSAKAIADRKINAQQEKDRQTLDVLKFDYQENKDQFTLDEQRQFEKMTRERERELDREDERLKTLSDTKIEAMKNANEQQAPVSILSAIQRANTSEEVISAAGKYGGDIKRKLEVQKLRTEIDNTASKTGGVADDLQAYASQYADTGKLPSPAELKLSGLSVGQVTSLAKQLPKPDGALVSKNTGSISSNLSTKQVEGITSLSEIVRTTLPNLQRLFPKIYTGLLGGLGGLIYTSQDKQDYETFRQEFLSKLLVARSGAAVTEQEYERYSKLLPTTFNQLLGLGSDGSRKLKSLETSMKNNLDTVLNTNQQVINGYSKIKVNGVLRTVGEILDIGGNQYRVLADGTLTDIL